MACFWICVWVMLEGNKKMPKNDMVSLQTYKLVNAMGKCKGHETFAAIVKDNVTTMETGRKKKDICYVPVLSVSERLLVDK